MQSILCQFIFILLCEITVSGNSSIMVSLLLHHQELHIFLHGKLLVFVLQNISAIMYLLFGEICQSEMCAHHCTAL